MYAVVCVVGGAGDNNRMVFFEIDDAKTVGWLRENLQKYEYEMPLSGLELVLKDDSGDRVLYDDDVLVGSYGVEGFLNLDSRPELLLQARHKGMEREFEKTAQESPLHFDFSRLADQVDIFRLKEVWENAKNISVRLNTIEGYMEELVSSDSFSVENEGSDDDAPSSSDGESNNNDAVFSDSDEDDLFSGEDDDNDVLFFDYDQDDSSGAERIDAVVFADYDEASASDDSSSDDDSIDSLSQASVPVTRVQLVDEFELLAKRPALHVDFPRSTDPVDSSMIREACREAQETATFLQMTMGDIETLDANIPSVSNGGGNDSSPENNSPRERSSFNEGDSDASDSLPVSVVAYLVGDNSQFVFVTMSRMQSVSELRVKLVEAYQLAIENGQEGVLASNIELVCKNEWGSRILNERNDYDTIDIHERNGFLSVDVRSKVSLESRVVLVEKEREWIQHNDSQGGGGGRSVSLLAGMRSYIRRFRPDPVAPNHVENAHADPAPVVNPSFSAGTNSVFVAFGSHRAAPDAEQGQSSGGSPLPEGS